MSQSEHSHTHAHTHAKDCSCDHQHDHGHDHNPLKLSHRWIVSVLIIVALLVLLRPFIVAQMIVRVTSYSVNSAYDNAIRICKKIILIDPDNKQAWTAMGYAYMDSKKVDLAINAFEKVLVIDPQDKGAASFELGQAYYAKGDFNNAIESFERVRSAGPKAATLLEADILKYRHGTLGFRSLNSMQILLGQLLDCYQKTGNTSKIDEVQKEYDLYKSKHRRILF